MAGLNDTQSKFVRKYILDFGQTNSSAPSSVSLVSLQQARLAWAAERKRVAGQLDALEMQMIADFRGAEDASKMTAAAGRVQVVLEVIDDSLEDLLDRALNAADPDVRATLHGEAQKTISRYLVALDSNPVIAMLDRNPFMRVDIAPGLRNVLTGLQDELG